MDVNSKLIAISVLILILMFVIYHSTHKNDELTCDKFIVNIYLYLILAIFIVNFVIILSEKRRLLVSQKMMIIFSLLIIGYLIAYSRVDNIWASYVLWTAAVVLLGFVCFYWKNKFKDDSSVDTFLFTLLVVVTTAYFTSYLGFNIQSVSIMVTVSLASTYLIAYLISWQKTKWDRTTMVAVVMAVIGAGLLYTTQTAIERGHKCSIPNYPQSSTNLLTNV